jgi:hypothetical protein
MTMMKSTSEKAKGREFNSKPKEGTREKEREREVMTFHRRPERRGVETGSEGERNGEDQEKPASKRTLTVRLNEVGKLRIRFDQSLKLLSF